MVKLYINDLGGLTDLATGEDLSFDILEIKMERSEDNLKLNEILALFKYISFNGRLSGSIIASLRGTLVPAKL